MSDPNEKNIMNSLYNRFYQWKYGREKDIAIKKWKSILASINPHLKKDMRTHIKIFLADTFHNNTDFCSIIDRIDNFLRDWNLHSSKTFKCFFKTETNAVILYTIVKIMHNYYLNNNAVYECSYDLDEFALPVFLGCLCFTYAYSGDKLALGSFRAISNRTDVNIEKIYQVVHDITYVAREELTYIHHDLELFMKKVLELRKYNDVLSYYLQQ